jgi:hypothetical protein
MFRSEDIEKIKLNINFLKDKAVEEYKTLYEPTLTEISEVYNIIKKYIIKKKRVVYGGFAQNLLLKVKNPDIAFYRQIGEACYNWPDLADIDFYSTEPLKDLHELTEELYDNKFKYVEGKEAVHEGTYKIFINFINYCEITYIPTNVFDNLPIMNVDNILCVHPHFMMVDAYRILTDITSNFRWEKVISRFNKLIQNYPINESLVDSNINIKLLWNTVDFDVLKFIRNNIIKKSKLIVVGFYAYDYFTKKQNENDMIKKYPYYELISSELQHDTLKIYNLLVKQYEKKNIKVKEYNKFFQFLDKKVEFYYNNNLILILHGNNEKCIVYNYSNKKKTYFGTFNLVFMYLLFSYYYYYINKDKKYVEFYDVLISKLFYNKIKYLNKRGINVLDKSPFQDFTYKCIGFPVDQLRQSFLEGYKKKNLGKKIKYNYTPTGKNKPPPNIVYANTSGNQIFSEKNLILKNI